MGQSPDGITSFHRPGQRGTKLTPTRAPSGLEGRTGTLFGRPDTKERGAHRVTVKCLVTENRREESEH